MACKRSRVRASYSPPQGSLNCSLYHQRVKRGATRGKREGCEGNFWQFLKFLHFFGRKICRFKILLYLCTRNTATGCSAVRLAHLVWDQRVPGSNPGTPTKRDRDVSLFCYWLCAFRSLWETGVSNKFIWTHSICQKLYNKRDFKACVARKSGVY